MVRRKMRETLSRRKLLGRIPEDLEWIFKVDIPEGEPEETVGNIWDEEGTLPGGKNWGGDAVP